VPVPEHFKNFPIRKQGERDYACGLYCVVSAATHLSALHDRGDGLAHVLAHVDANISATLSKSLLTSGVSDRDVRLLAAAANLDVWRPQKAKLKDLTWNGEKRKHVWMALVRMRFDDPNRVVASYDDLHYVLVLEMTGTPPRPQSGDSGTGSPRPIGRTADHDPRLR
jgi:hypothetical protein